MNRSSLTNSRLCEGYDTKLKGVNGVFPGFDFQASKARKKQGRSQQVSKLRSQKAMSGEGRFATALH